MAANSDTATDGCAAGSGVDVIEVPAGLYRFTLDGTDEDFAATGDLDVITDMEIVGAGAGATILDADYHDRVLDIDPFASGDRVVVRQLSVINGGQNEGGGVRNHGNLRLESVEVAHNVVYWIADALGGGISNRGTLAIVGSSIYDNSVETRPFLGSVSASGGGIWSLGPLDITASTIRQNGAAAIGDNHASGGGIDCRGPLVIRDSTISPNSAVSDGISSGGGISASSSLTMTNCTVSGNLAAGGRLGEGFGGGLLVDDATVANSTITGNDALLGQAVQVAGEAAFSNTIVDGGCDDLLGNGTILGDAHNLATSETCGFSGTDLVGVSPMLDPLQDNGGPTFTHALPLGSPALDAGNPAAPGSGGACAARDQRGVIRPQRGRCDIGAYESQDLTGYADSFKCYTATDLRDPLFDGAAVSLADRFADDAGVAVKKPSMLCNPADTGAGIRNAVDHLVCHKIDADRLDPRVRVESANAFGTVRLELGTPKFLCVRSSKQALP